MLHVDKVDSLLHYEYGNYHSYCIIQSDEFGNIDLRKSKPIRGTYDEIDEMGLFLSIQPSQEHRYGAYLRNHLANPFYYTLELISESEEVIDRINLIKRWCHPLVSQINIAEPEFHGTIFKPPGPGPFPCIIDVPGATGNLSNGHASVLSASGFLVYTFAYYDYKDLPKKLQDVDVEVFSKHIRFVQSLPYCSGKIGLYGASLGGTIACFLATKHPELSAVVSLNGPEAFYKDTGSMKENGKTMECETYNHKSTTLINGIVKQKDNFLELFNKLKPETSIKWDTISKNIPFRIVSAIDDWLLCGVTNGLNMRNHLQKTGHFVEMDFIFCGHMVFVPYYPFQAFAYNKYVRVSLGFGGDCTISSKTKETLWQRNIEFFKKYLGIPPNVPDYPRKSVIFVPDSAKSKM
uniref:Thioesterase domain-containing protein n=1 Tax=Caenorhabditis tropicalis TaxID=1561998 RepID=A0A1I7TKP3_9PELO